MNSDQNNYVSSTHEPSQCFVFIGKEETSSSACSSPTIFPFASQAEDENLSSPLVPPSPEESESSFSLENNRGAYDVSRLGDGFQASLPPLRPKPNRISPSDRAKTGNQVWSSGRMSETGVDKFVDSVSNLCTREQACKVLHEHNYSVGAARAYVLQNYSRGEFLTEDDSWSHSDKEAFDTGFYLYGKDLPTIHHRLLPHKRYGQLVNYYYRNKRRRTSYAHKYFHDRVAQESVDNYLCMEDDSSRESLFIPVDQNTDELDSPCSPSSFGRNTALSGIFGQPSEDDFAPVSDTAFNFNGNSQTTSSLLTDATTGFTNPYSVYCSVWSDWNAPHIEDSKQSKPINNNNNNTDEDRFSFSLVNQL